MIDPRTTNIVGSHIRIVNGTWRDRLLGRGVVRVVDYNQGTFVLLVEDVGHTCSDYFGVGERGLFQVSLADESLEVVAEDAP